MIRADLALVLDPLVDLGEAIPAPFNAPPSKAAKEKSTAAKTRETPAFPPPAAVPAWARASGRAGESDPLFFAGAGLALLDGHLRSDPRAAGALRSRLALRSAAASAKILRLNADTAALRDLRFATGDASPAARLLHLWRELAARPPSLDPTRLAAAAAALDCPAPNADALAETLREQSRAGDPVSAATKAAACAFSAFPDAPTADAEIFALWTFDLVLAIRLRWPRPVPLVGTKILDPALRSHGGARLRPGDSAWASTAARAITLAAAAALDLAADLSRRADTLRAVAPKLRAKPAQKIVTLLLAQDCVSPAEAARQAPMTDRAARRLFDRLVALGAVREFSGRPAFRLLRLMTAAARRRGREGDEVLDLDLLDLPPAARWREWMLRVEAAIFASAKPVPREALVRIVGQDCRFDDLIADLVHELRGRPYDLVQIAGGYALRTKTRFAPAIRAAHPGRAGDDVGELTKTETFALTAIAYLQPVTRGEISKLAGREISRDVIAALKRHGLIDGAIRAPQPGAPFAYVTTRKFLEAFGFASLRDLPDLERLEAEGLLDRGQGDGELDGALGLTDTETDEGASSASELHDV